MKKIFNIILLSVLVLYSDSARTADYNIYAEVESRRKDNIVTLLFNVMPDRAVYNIIENDEIIGTITIVNINPVAGRGSVYRVFAEYDIADKKMRG
jgi:hypothetical protein